MSGEYDRIQKLESKVEQHSMIVEQHSLILKGDDTDYPPKPGVMHVLKQISEQIGHPESGNLALYQAVKGIHSKDQERVAFYKGSKFLIILLWTIGGFAVGILTMLRIH